MDVIRGLYIPMSCPVLIIVLAKCSHIDPPTLNIMQFCCTHTRVILTHWCNIFFQRSNEQEYFSSRWPLFSAKIPFLYYYRFQNSAFSPLCNWQFHDNGKRKWNCAQGCCKIQHGIYLFALQRECLPFTRYFIIDNNNISQKNFKCLLPLLLAVNIKCKWNDHLYHLCTGVNPSRGREFDLLSLQLVRCNGDG